MREQKTTIIASSVSDRSYYIRLGDNRLVMIDMGCVNLTRNNVDSKTLFESFVDELKSVCQSEVIRVAALFITHPHDDHLNLLENLKNCGLDKHFIFEKIIRHFPSAERMPKNNWEKPEYPNLIESVLQKMAENGTEIITAKRNMSFKFGENKFEILLTPDEFTDQAKDLNYFSLLIRQTYKGKIILWTGDMSDSLSLTALKLYGDGLKCDILQIPHHGTPNCGVMEFFNTCDAALHLWSIAEKTFTDPQYAFAYGKYPIPTSIFDMPQKKIFCGGKNLIEIPLE